MAARVGIERTSILGATTASGAASVVQDDELGYFKNNGVTVEITSYRGVSAAQEALAAGEADMMFPSEKN